MGWAIGALLALLLSAPTLAQDAPPGEVSDDAPGPAFERLQNQLGEVNPDDALVLLESLAPVAEANASLAGELEHTRSEQEQILGADGELAALQNRVAQSQQNVDQLLDIGLRGADVGQLLRRERQRLPTSENLRQQFGELQQTALEARLRKLQLQQALVEVTQVEATVDEQLEQVAPESAARMQSLAEEVLGRQQNLLKENIAAYTEFIDSLADSELGHMQLIQRSSALDQLLDEHLFWVRSTEPVGLEWPGRIAVGLGWLLAPSGWSQVATALARGLATWPWLSAALAALLAILLAQRGRLRRINQANAAFIGEYNDRFRYTLAALGITLLRALPWALSLLWIGFLVRDASLPESIFAHSIGAGLMASAVVWYVFEVFRYLCRPNGMMRRHFGWSEHARSVLYSTLRWLTWVMVAATFVVAATRAGENSVAAEGLGRLFFMLASLAMSVTAWLVLHPRRGALGDLINRGGKLWQTRWLWFPMTVGAPLAIGLLAASGFYFTASQLQDRVFSSGWLVVVGFIAYGLALRWLLVVNRKLAYRRALEQQKQAIPLSEKAASGEARPARLEIPQVDLSSISEHTRTLLRLTIGVGTFLALWAVWEDVIPALNILDQITLWSRPAEGGIDGPLGQVTLGDLFYCVLALILTVIAARNLPGLAEMILMPRLSLDPGSRYALITIGRYLIVAVGFGVAVSFLGVDWSKLQWIIAALGVGLGFGLQEIVAKFVSGLIILFERPVRVGDTVTVGGVDGTISRLRIRATTITDWDNREILVPNKNFITDPVTNWTLTDPVNRLFLQVGVAYGSDTTEAQRVILEAVKSVPLVLDEPEPTVFFMGFGDSSLDFEIRAFAASLEDRLPCKHQIHARVNQALHDAGIVIPFPQRDLHWRTSAPSDSD